MMYTLRFDVETLIIATTYIVLCHSDQLRFDVETLIIATLIVCVVCLLGCGLM